MTLEALEYNDDLLTKKTCALTYTHEHRLHIFHPSANYSFLKQRGIIKSFD